MSAEIETVHFNKCTIIGISGKRNQREAEPKKEMQVRTGENLSYTLMRDGIKEIVPLQNGFSARKYGYRQEMEQYVQHLRTMLP